MESVEVIISHGGDVEACMSGGSDDLGKVTRIFPCSQSRFDLSSSKGD